MIKKLVCYIEDIFWLLLKTNYILVSSYPKTGSTVLRMRLVSYLHGLESVNHQIINELSPEIGKGKVKYRLSKNNITVVKTHFFIFKYVLRPKLTISLFRDPRDTLCSHYTYYNRQDKLQRSKSNINKFIMSKYGFKWLNNHIRFAVRNKQTHINILYKNYLEAPSLIHQQILLQIPELNYNANKWDNVLRITSRDAITRNEYKSKKKSVKNFSVIKDYSNLRKELNTKSIKKIQILNNRFNNLFQETKKNQC